MAAADRVWSALPPRARWAAATILLAIATLPVLSRQYIGKTHSDLAVYLAGVEALLEGRLYDGHVFEYPPYALIWFLAPSVWAHDLESYRLAFGLQIWLFDAAIKATLLWRALRARSGFPDLVPFFVYSLGSAALGHVLLMRYDAIPGGLSLAGALAVTGGWPLLGGAVTALAAGTKAYPVLFIPILGVVAWRQSRGNLRRFALGVAAGTVPLLALAAWMPWWKFVAFHDERGLEAGSLVASLIWTLHRFAGVDATWSLVGTSNEVGGPLAAQLLVPARLFWVVSTLACVGVAIVGALRLARANAAAQAASAGMLMLLTVVAFVATNTVFSPQFHLWLIPLAALVLEGRATLPPSAVTAGWLVFVATMIVPAFFPHRQFGQGLGPALILVLLLRNLLLVGATFLLIKAAFAMGRAPKQAESIQSGRLV